MSPRAGWSFLALPLLAAGLLSCGGPEVSPDEEGVAALDSALVPGDGLCLALAATLEAECGGTVPDDLLRRRVAELHARVAAACGAGRRTLAVLDDSRLVLRALPGGHDQVSRGLLEALAGQEPAEGRAALAALLGRLCGLARAAGPERAAGRAARASGIAALPSGLRPLLQGEPGAAELAGQVGPLLQGLRGWRAEAPLSDEADRAALAALDELGLPRQALPRAWASLDAVAALDPARAAPLIASHGQPLDRQRAAAALLARLPGPADPDPRPREEEALDLTGLRADAALQARLDAAALCARRGQSEEALRLLEGARGPRAALVRGQALLAAGKAQEAERAWRAGLLLHAGCAPARLLLARLYVDQGRREAAQVELDEAGPRMPLLPGLLLLRAEADPARAEPWLRAVLALDAPDGAAAAAARARLEAGPPAPPVPPPDRPRIMGGG